METVELLPDVTTERTVRVVWRRLSDAGLPSQAAHRHPTNRPHLTLATADTLDPEVRVRLKRILTALPVPLHLDGTVRFDGRTPVLAWAVRPDEALLHLHEAVWRTLRDTPACGRLNPLHDPERWKPHITLARGRDAAYPETPLFSAAPGGPDDALTGEWVGARTYDSVVRSTTPLDSVRRS
ncbi:2'-5' RNA ligase family protein [Streptomyces sp. NPDC059517]|uniref:2'-5' RNA ligase family protein n=1 Tax=Streptomyces sp. NPDC059517 TaxID=3346855 RepID=UPI0036BD007E